MADNFDPDAYLAATSSQSGFNPDAYLAATSSGGNQNYSQPLPGNEPNNVGGPYDPNALDREKIQGMGVKDATVMDGMNIQGLGGLAKTGGALAARGLGAALDAIPATENLTPTIQRIANNQTLKSFGGTMGQLNKMAKGRGGREALDNAAQFARDKGLANVLSTSIGREKAMNALKDASGRAIGALRDEAGEGPKTSELVKNVQDKFGPKYASGIHSGESGEFQNSIDEINKLSPVREIPQSEKIGSYLEDSPESSIHNVDIQEPNTAYRDQFIRPSENLDRTVQVSQHPYEDARHSVEDFDVPDYDVSGPPSHSAIADKMTELNKYASDQSGMLRPNSATTDVTDSISARNNADIAQKLGSTKAKQYVDALDEHSKLAPLEHLQERGELRQAGGRGGIGTKIIQEIADRFGYRLTAQRMAALHDALTGKNLAESLATVPKNLGKSAPTIDQKIHDYLIKERQKRGE